MKQKKSFRRENNGGARRVNRAVPPNITGAKQSHLESKLDNREKILRDLNQQIDDAFKKATAEELTPGDAPHLFALLGRITKSIERIDKENPTGPDEETDPRIVALLDIGKRITDLLDPLVRENYKDNPEELAKWEEAISMGDDIDEENDKNGRSQN